MEKITLFLNKFVVFRFMSKVSRFVSNLINKLFMAIIFYCVFTPVSMILKLLGKDLLNKKIDKNVNSYWVERKIQPTSLKHQF